MWVYIIESTKASGRRYVGLSEQPRIRLRQHNEGGVQHTARHRPWTLVAAIWVANKTAGRELEAYLKTGSGAAFARRHFPSPDLDRGHSTTL